MRDEKGEKLEEATYECEAGVRLELSKPDCEYGRDTLFGIMERRLRHRRMNTNRIVVYRITGCPSFGRHADAKAVTHVQLTMTFDLVCHVTVAVGPSKTGPRFAASRH